jgi:hypothetical protein
MTSADRRIRRLLRWYPRVWRENREAEFAALLEDSISERPFWPRRELNVAIEGSLLRISDLSRRVSTPHETPMSPRTLWLAVSLALFVGYSSTLITLASTTAYAHGFEDATLPLSLIVGTIVILLGLSLIALGLKRAIETRSARATWPSLVLGGSLIAAVACDWWISVGGEWGWSSIANSFVSLDPYQWKRAFSSYPQEWGFRLYEFRLYLVINLCLLSMIAVSGAALVRRLRRQGGARPSGGGLVVGMLAVLSAAWVWVIDSPGQNPAHVFIASALTIAMVSTSLSLLGRSRRRVVPG